MAMMNNSDLDTLFSTFNLLVFPTLDSEVHYVFQWLVYLHFTQNGMAWGCCCCCLVASVMSDSVRPHRQQLTRLLCPWDSPGKNTGVGCHALLQCMKVKSESEITHSFLTLSDPMDCSLPDSSVHGIFQARLLEWVAIAFFRNGHITL